MLGLLLTAGPLYAEPVTLQLYGTMDSVQGSVSHALSVGDPFEFTWTYDTGENVPACCAPYFNSYFMNVSIVGSIGSYHVDPFTALMPVYSSFSGSSRMIFELDASSSHLPGTLLPGDWGVRALSFFYSDSLTPGGQLPTNVNPGSSMEFGVYYTQLDPSGRVAPASGNFGSTFTINRVPEPGTSLLVGAGLVMLGVRRAIRTTRRRPSGLIQLP
jgi:hypothetical protein